MHKIGRFFKCPLTGSRPGLDCARCNYRIIRGPGTNEAAIFPVATPFCIKEAE